MLTRMTVENSMLAASWEEGMKPGATPPTKTLLQSRLADKLIGVFRPETLGRLARRQPGRARCDIGVTCRPPSGSMSFGFATNSKKEVTLETAPEDWIETPNFVSIYDGHYLDFEETWRDTGRLLGAPLTRGPRLERIAEMLDPLEHAMRGKIVLDNNGRFYLRGDNGLIEMPLVAEGLLVSEIAQPHGVPWVVSRVRPI